METKHEISKFCLGESCHCSVQATHKIAEVLQDGQERHELVAYVCCRHFNKAVRPYLPSGYDAPCELP